MFCEAPAAAARVIFLQTVTECHLLAVVLHLSYREKHARWNQVFGAHSIHPKLLKIHCPIRIVFDIALAGTRVPGSEAGVWRMIAIQIQDLENWVIMNGTTWSAM